MKAISCSANLLIGKLPRQRDFKGEGEGISHLKKTSLMRAAMIRAIRTKAEKMAEPHTPDPLIIHHGCSLRLRWAVQTS
jgi:hypothetical protein